MAEVQLYPTGSTSLDPRPEGVNVQDARRVHRGRHEIDRAVIWSAILYRMRGSMVNEALHYKINKARREKNSRKNRNRAGSVVSSTGSVQSTEGGERPKGDWWRCGWCKMKAPPPVSDPSFVVFPKLPMQPDIPATKKQKVLAWIAAIAASALLGISIAIAKMLLDSFDNSVEIVLLYQLCGTFLASIPSYLFYRYVSESRRKIWGRLLGDEQYINYKRGAMCSVRALCVIVGLVCEYYAMDFMVPGDGSMIIYSASIFGAIGAMLCRKRRKDFYLICLGFLPLIGFGFILFAEPDGSEVVDIKNYRSAGLGLSIIAMMTIAVNQYILRFLRYVHWSITEFVFGITGSSMTVVFVLCNRAKFSVPIGSEAFLFGAYTLSSIFGELFWQYAHKYESLATLGAIRFVVEVPIVYALEFYVYKWTPNVFVGVGGAIIASAVMLWAVKEWKTSNDKKDENLE